jgi:hypothetical protein
LDPEEEEEVKEEEEEEKQTEKLLTWSRGGAHLQQKLIV